VVVLELKELQELTVFQYKELQDQTEIKEP
jgi:hypothetical protein